MKQKFRIGLTLSGGGAKGAAHIGILKALEERNINIDVISGTSSGSIVGALFAYGYSSDEILDFFLSTTIFKPGYYTWKKPGILDTEALGGLLEPLLKENAFAALKVPMYIVATDIENARSKVFSKGELIKPILASCSFPGVFAPVKIQDRLYSDGGILNNFPVEIIRQECEVLIGANVQIVDFVDKRKLKSTFSLVQRVFNISTRYNSLQKYHDCDLVISPLELSKFATFNMFKMKKMYQIGYEEASKKLDAFAKQNEHFVSL